MVGWISKNGLAWQACIRRSELSRWDKMGSLIKHRPANVCSLCGPVSARVHSALLVSPDLPECTRLSQQARIIQNGLFGRLGLAKKGSLRWPRWPKW